MAFKLCISILLLATSVYAANFKRVACADGSTATNAVCCTFNALRDDLQANLFGHVCGEEVHESLRISFHDAIGFSSSNPSAGGGADGSMMTFSNIETAFAANNGIIDSVNFLDPFLKSHNVTPGDLIQFAAAVGITNCAGAPRLQFKAGRPPPKAAAIDGLVPEPQQNLDTIFARFADGGGFSPTEVAALLVSHTIARSDHVIPGSVAVPMDSTPFTFDSQFFVEIQLRGTGFPGDGSSNSGQAESPLPQSSGQNVGELRLISDMNLARDSRTACTFQSFVNNHNLMATSFANAMAKMAVIGQNTKNFVDCSESVPQALAPSSKPPTLPAGKTMADIEQACASSPFPTLSADPGPATLIPHCPPSQGGDADNCDSDPGSL